MGFRRAPIGRFSVYLHQKTGVPPLPLPFFYMTDGGGNYLKDNNGNYFIVELNLITDESGNVAFDGNGNYTVNTK